MNILQIHIIPTFGAATSGLHASIDPMIAMDVEKRILQKGSHLEPITNTLSRIDRCLRAQGALLGAAVGVCTKTVTMFEPDGFGANVLVVATLPA